MKLFLRFIGNKKSLLTIGLIATVVLLVSLPNRAIQSDENWFGEQAYWLVNEGAVKIKSIPGIFNWVEIMPVHHKLLTWSGAAIVKVFGWSLTPLRIFMLVLVASTCLVLVQLTRLKKSNFERDSILLAMLILLVTPEFIVRVNLFRPEILVMFFGMVTYYFLYKIYLSEKLVDYFLLGIFAGLAFLTHLNALIFPVAVFLLILRSRNWKGLLLFSSTCFVVCSFYTEGLWVNGNLEQYLFELKNWPSHSFKSKVEGGILNSIWHNIAGVLDEHKRYFWSQEVWLISGSFFLCILLYGRRLRSMQPVLTDYLVLLMILMGLVSSGNAPRYLIYFMPLMALIIALTIIDIWRRKSIVPKLLVISIFMAQLVFLGITYTDIFNRKVDHALANEEVLSQVPEQASVIGYWELIFNNIENYKLRNFKTYEYLEESRVEKFTQLEVFKDLYDNKVEYIVLNEQMKKDKVFHWFYGWEIVDNNYYVKHYQTDEFLILKRI